MALPAGGAGFWYDGFWVSFLLFSALEDGFPGVVFFEGSLIAAEARAPNSAIVDVSKRVSSPHISQI